MNHCLVKGKSLTNERCGTSCNHRVRQDGLRHHRTSADDRTAANGHATQNHRATSDPYIVLNHNAEIVTRAFFCHVNHELADYRSIVPSTEQAHVRAEHHMASDANLGLPCDECGSDTQKDITSDRDVMKCVVTVRIERKVWTMAFEALSKQPDPWASRNCSGKSEYVQ